MWTIKITCSISPLTDDQVSEKRKTVVTIYGTMITRNKSVFVRLWWNKSKGFIWNRYHISSSIIINYHDNLSKFLKVKYLQKSLFLSTDHIQISIQLFDFILRNLVLLFWDFNGNRIGKEDLQVLVLKSEEKK